MKKPSPSAVKRPKAASKTDRKAPSAEALASAAEVLTAQAWAEADQALADALIAQSRVNAAFAALGRKLARNKRATPKLAEAGDTLDGELLSLTQSLHRAAKARGLALFGDPGAVQPYDPKRHRLVRGDATKTAAVKVIAPGVALGRTVIACAEVRPAAVKPTKPTAVAPSERRKPPRRKPEP